MQASISPNVAWIEHLLLFVVLGAALTEAVFKSVRTHYDWPEFWCSLGDLVVRRASEALPFGIAIPLLQWAWSHHWLTLSLDRWWTWLLLFVGEEFCYYWYHRCSHRIRWFWATHAVHHSPNHVNFANAYRLGWTGKLTGTPLFFVPLILLGFEPSAVLGAVAVNLLYQFWLHADWIPKLGWLEYLLNTPSHHRVHHASNVEYLDCNYGGVIILFDRCFGTFREERSDIHCRYGLVKPVPSHNPLYVGIHEWMSLASDLRSARSFHEAWCFTFGAPGWSPPKDHVQIAIDADDQHASSAKHSGKPTAATTCNNSSMQVTSTRA